MDSSDSEQFESADEEFPTQTEHKTVKTKSSDEQKDSCDILELQAVSSDNDSKKVLTSDVNRQAHKNKSIERSDKPAKPTRSKLGSKLGVRMGSTKCNIEDNKLKFNDNTLNSPLKENETFVSALKDIKNEENLQKVDKQEDPLVDEEFNMWADDEWEPVCNTEEQSSEKSQNNSSNWGGWGNWNVTSLLSTASMGVTTIKSHVSQGISTVLESGIGVPDPEELARLHKMDERSKEGSVKAEEEREVNEEEEVERKNNKMGVPDLTFGLGSLVSGVSQITKLVETTGNKVISSGLDTLETIGKKTFEVLQEGDPGLKKKRAFLKIESDKPVLSHLLREAKEKAEEENKLAEERHVSKKANYETLFDDHQGLAHLEALEMLSRQCDIKLMTLLESQSGADLIEMQETLNQIKELCELNEEDEDEREELDVSKIKETLEMAVTELNISISYDKLVLTWENVNEWLKNLDLNAHNATELHEESINVLAQFTAVAVELFHKTGELLLIKEHRSTVDEADSLVQLTTTMTTVVSDIAKKASNKLNEKAPQSGNKDNINQFITNVYFEATNSSSYIKNAFELLIPVLQVGAV